MGGKKKKKKDGQKVHVDQVLTSAGDVADAITEGLKQDGSATVSASKGKCEGEAVTSPNLVEIVEPLLSLAMCQVSSPISAPPPLLMDASSTTKFTSPIATPGLPLDEEANPAGPSFVFSAGQNSATNRVAASPAIFSAQAAESSKVQNSRNSKQYARRREGKCPPSERFGKMGRSRQQILQLAAQEVAFGQGRDPLSLVVSYEENGLRRIVKVPEGCTSETIVDSSLRQAVAGAALDCAGWQEALNHPKEDGYFAYSTAPEGLTVAKFRDVKGKVLITPLSADCGLLKLKEEAEKQKNAAEDKLEKVKEYLRKLQSDDEKPGAGAELPGEMAAPCVSCKSMKGYLQDLYEIVTQPQTGDLKKNSGSADMRQCGKQQMHVLGSATSLV